MEVGTNRLIKILYQNLLLGNYEDLRQLSNLFKQDIDIRDSILQITDLFQQTVIQSQTYQINLFFYRNFLKEVMSGEISQSKIKERQDITPDKKQQVIEFLRIIKSNEKSLISTQSELQRAKRQLEEFRKQSIIKEEIEKDYSQREKKNDSLLKQYKQRIVQQQAQISMLKEQQKKKKMELNKLKSQIFQTKQELQKKQALAKDSANQSILFSQQLNQKVSIIVQYKKNQQELCKSLYAQKQQNHRLIQEIEIMKGQLEESRSSKIIKKMSTKEIFIDTNSIIQFFQMNEKAAENFYQTLARIIGEVTTMRSLYNYQLHKGENFHRRVDNHKNILLLCKTIENRIIGGFTSNGFSIKTSERQGKAFLFSFYEDEMKVFQLKKGRKTSTTYDNDYIIFGNEELCIQKGSDQLTSYFVNGTQNILHYECKSTADRQSFLSVKESGSDAVKLLNYEIIEVKIKSD